MYLQIFCYFYLVFIFNVRHVADVIAAPPCTTRAVRQRALFASKRGGATGRLVPLNLARANFFSAAQTAAVEARERK